MTALAARRRHPMATAVLVLLSLVLTGLVYAFAVPSRASASPALADDVASGHDLFRANCSTCHGLNAEGRQNAPSLVGVGAAAVDFQVGTGRMPLQATGPQAPRNTPRFSDAQVKQMAAYIASLGPGPAIPAADVTDPKGGDPVRGGELFRTNCAMCHNFAANGGALTLGKYAPNLNDTTPTHLYEAMLTGPQSMPVFSDSNIAPKDKQDIIAWVRTIKQAPSPGGLSLGGIGPVSEGLVGWVVGLAVLIGCAVWLGAKAS